MARQVHELQKRQTTRTNKKDRTQPYERGLLKVLLIGRGV